VEVVLSNVTTGVISVDHEGRITMINQRACHLLDISADNYIGKTTQEIAGADLPNFFRELKTEVNPMAVERLQKEIRIQVGDREIPLQTTLSFLYDEKGEILGKVLVFDDLSPVLNAQRAAAWTEVARRIAHEIKNPLTPIRLAAQRIKKKFGGEITDPAFSECVDMIIDQVDDLKALVNEFSNFARMPQVHPQLSDLNRIVEDALLLFPDVNPGANIVFEPDKTLPYFYFDPVQIRRALKNLIDNALSAIKNVAGGEIVVRTQFESMLKLVRMTVSDNGMGIPKVLRDRVFEPYVTTKAQGTGLGLAIVKRTVEDHNGFIRAFPNQPQGTRIVIELPVRDINIPSFVGEEMV
jgi:two-component system nitrogen regulation sensor histidine kinase NtrY